MVAETSVTFCAKILFIEPKLNKVQQLTLYLYLLWNKEMKKAVMPSFISLELFFLLFKIVTFTFLIVTNTML